MTARIPPQQVVVLLRISGVGTIDGDPVPPVGGTVVRTDAFDVAAVSYQIVLTKADKLKAPEVEAVTAKTLAAIAKRPAAFPRVLATSSEKGTGLPELRAEAAAAAFG